MTLAELERRVNRLQWVDPTTFTLEDGGTFKTQQDPVVFLLTNGPMTEQGRIVSIQRPTEEADALSEALYDYIDKMIAAVAL